MKPTVKKCQCGRVTNPVTINAVVDAWVKDKVAYFDFNCPQCGKKNNVKMLWDESCIRGTNRILATPNYNMMSK